MTSIKQYKFAEINNIQFDAILVSSGFESRASFQTSVLKNLPAQKIAFCFDSETDDAIRKKNDLFFISNGFKMLTINSEGNSLDLFEEVINEIISIGKNKPEINIYVDYSSMIRNWYAAIIHIINNITYSKPIKLHFGYSYAKFVSFAKEDVLNKVVEPLFGYCNLSLPYKPTALVICLGNEKNRVYGLQEYFDAATYLFYSDSAFDNKYSEEVEQVNFEILTTTKIDNIIKFPVHDLIHTNYLLENLCKVLRRDFRVIIAPCGPKPFTLLALLNSIKFNADIEVWRISPGKALPKINREPNQLVSMLEVSFEGDSN